eukprot:PITA_10633
MYAKCGSIEFAQRWFDKISNKNVVSWNIMISGYVQNGLAIEALILFRNMVVENVTQNCVTAAIVLQACAHLASLQQGMSIHGYILRRHLEVDVFVGNFLIDMYVKCGNVEMAQQVFDKMLRSDVVSWSAMITGYTQSGHAKEALSLFQKMQLEGLRPNSFTMASVLPACAHLKALLEGLVDEGMRYFDFMIQDYCITPSVDHFTCMIDLLGCAGRLSEAQEIIERMPLKPNISVWGALLGACRVHRNIKLAQYVAERLFELDPKNVGYYVLLSNIYAASGRWNDVAKVRTMMKELGLRKTPRCSLILVNKRFHAFFVGDRSHPQSENVYGTLETLVGQMKEAGYIPNTDFVLHDVEEEVKGQMLSSHSEKLAIAFGLINTSPSTAIRITKNLRMCGDCHNATKFISKIVRREIIVRDANRFHYFINGFCSCKDYW